MRAVALALAVAGIPLMAAAAGAVGTKLDGNELLARSAKLNHWPESYTVALHFTVHVHRPVSIRFGANALTYFKAPDKQALTITSLPRALGRLFSRNYSRLDTIPEAWPSKYRVTTVTLSSGEGAPAYHLDAVPTYAGDITHVTFDLLENELIPVGAVWFYRDGSSVRLRVTSERVGAYVLPRHEEVTIAMPRYVLEASADAGRYDFDTPIPDGVFGQP